MLAGPAAAQPLDLQDPTPRSIRVEMSGQSVVASYTVDAGLGVIAISAEDHEQLRPHSLDPVPGSFTALEITIDLAQGIGTSSQASGAWSTDPLSESFVQGPLSTEELAGYIQSSQLPPLLCTSQQTLDDLCLVQPIFCGAVCVPVPGSRYDAGSGAIELVGGEERIGCDGAVCFGPYTYFSMLDPLLSELEAPSLPSVPSLSGAGRALVVLALVAATLAVGPVGSFARRFEVRTRSGYSRSATSEGNGETMRPSPVRVNRRS